MKFDDIFDPNNLHLILEYYYLVVEGEGSQKNKSN